MNTQYPYTVGRDIKTVPFYLDPNVYWFGIILSFGAAVAARGLNFSGWDKTSKIVNTIGSSGFILFIIGFIVANANIGW